MLHKALFISTLILVAVFTSACVSNAKRLNAGKPLIDRQ